MRGKRVIALLLSLGMAMTAVAGCSKGENANTGTENQSKDTVAVDNGEDTADSTAADDEEMTEIHVELMALGPVDKSNSDAIQEKINELTEPAINVHVNIEWSDAGTYGTKVPMMIQGGDDLDLMMFTPVPSASYAAFLGAGQLMDITDLLDEYGQDIKEIQGDLINGCQLNGKIYGVGNYGGKGGYQVMLIRKDVLEEVNRVEDAEKASSWSEVEDIMKDVVAAGYSGFINVDDMGTTLSSSGFKNGSDAFANNKCTDGLGDGYSLISSDEATDTVECRFFTDDYKEECERVARWYDEGLIYKDAANANDYGDTLLKSGAGVAKVVEGDGSTLPTVSAGTGHDYVAIKITNKQVMTGSCTKFGYGIPVTAKNPEAAMKYLNFIYTSEEAMNTLTWGIEGRDWVLNDEGYATYPDGVTADTVQYHTGDFLFGNTTLVNLWEGSVMTREEQIAEMQDSGLSKYFGFQLDNTGLENTVTACYNVVQQYVATLAAGSAGSNWEKTYDEFLSALKSAGIDDLVAAYQTQLDDWLATQN